MFDGEEAVPAVTAFSRRALLLCFRLPMDAAGH
jgi:hypothetical protein